MYEDLAALAPSAIVCAAFLWGIWALIRREMAPKRVAREDEDQDALAGDSAPASGTLAGSAPASGAASPAAAGSATRSGEEAAASASKHGEL
ncbi:MAG TPA: hypothetical protein VGG75_08280 [Trebonia sp.]|jgi:hypothetical protein